MPDATQNSPTPDDADYLVDQYVAGRLTDAEAERLLALLRDRPDVGGSLLDQLRVDALLRDEIGSAARQADEEPAARPMRIGPASADRRVSWRTGLFALAACLIVSTALVAVFVFRRPPGTAPIAGPTTVPTAPAVNVAVAEEATTAAVAVLTRTVDVAWADPSASLAAGAPLERGWIRLSSGLAEVEFFSGARVVVEGPAELQLLSPMEAFCKAGRLTADVPPPARGFKVNTPNGAVVDLGTSFAMDVSAAGGPAVHVFKGEVEVHPPAKPGLPPGNPTVHSLKEGAAAAVNPDGGLRLFAADPAAFTARDELDRRAAAAAARGYDAWRAAAARWNADPSLAFRFDFESLDARRSLPNRAAAAGAAAGAASGGTPVGCSAVEGRWPGKGALEFRGVGDRVRLAVPGELTSFTFVASVRVHGLDRRFNSLLMSDAFDPGAIHWQILNEGKVRLGIAGGKRFGLADYDSPVVFRPERFGQWAHLAVVYDAGNKRVTHYVDGRPVSREPMRYEMPLRLGSAELGNWSHGPRRTDPTAIRHFSGRMDDVAVYRRALTDAEVEGLYRADGGTAPAR